MVQNTIPLDQARWKLAGVWFSCSGIIFILLIIQSIGGVYGEEVQRVWSWALPNFLPTLALMVSVFAADALKPDRNGKNKTYIVRKNFYQLSLWLSIFYLLTLMLSILSPPIANYFSSQPIADRIKILETSNLWLGPLQGLVVVALGILFFLKDDEDKK
jgi:hypothetical protein